MSFLFLFSYKEREGWFSNCTPTGIIDEKKVEDDEDDEYHESTRRSVRSSVVADSDSD